MRPLLHCEVGGLHGTSTRHLRLGLTQGSSTLAWLNISPRFLLLTLGPLCCRVKDVDRHPLLFSQRGRGVMLGRWWMSLDWKVTR